ncbi:MAG TPA: TetR/AcrR family transcriptional regulator [Candidatus Dormibacteraeota bacterium]|nr:TetR/AcrR family transcriptional regulator [Candidatus Dormibacteraeota bacterium]
MARTVNPAVHMVKREAFIEAALRLMQTRGYEQMSIQDVLDEVDASRGAFYHYFESKQALLGALVDRIADQALAVVAPVVDDPDLTAIQKLERFFGGIAQYKSERKALMLEFIKVWKSDDMAIVREKVRHTVLERVAPILGRIVRQGVAEEIFSVDSADETATILMTLMLGFQDGATDLYLARQANTISYEEAEGRLHSFARAFERILGAPAGSVRVTDDATLREWFG